MVNMGKGSLRDQAIIFAVEAQQSPIQTINGVKLTPREIDMLASILSGRSGKMMASFLNISTKTLEAHIHNLMLKFECNSRESIRSLLENSDEVTYLRSHYLSLRLQEIFQKSLKKVHLLLKTKRPTCFLTYPQSNIDKETEQWVLKGYVGFQKFLEQLGLKVVLKSLKDGKSLVKHIKDIRLKGRGLDERYFYLIDNALLLALEEDSVEVMDKNVFLLLSQEVSRESSLERFKTDNKPFNHYFLWLDILKRMFPETDFSEIFGDFRAQYDDLLEKNYHNVPAAQSVSAAKNDSDNENRILLQENKTPYEKSLWLNRVKGSQFLKYALFSLLGIVVLLLFKETGTIGILMPHQNKASDIQSDLFISNNAMLLKRPYLMKAIEEKLKGQPYIKTVAIIGAGGVGKTTLARYFGRLKNYPIVWEVNAENKDTLINSLKELGEHLAATKDEKVELGLIKDIQNPEERDKKLLNFVRSHLKSQSQWLLIYDNVEALMDIKRFLPTNPNTWGNGKVIITTQNSNLQNSSFIGPNNFVHIGELSKAESLELLSKIIHGCEPDKLSVDQKNKALNFLKHIPAYPLDISVAAYYVKDNHMSYNEYILQITQSSQYVETVMEKIVKEKSDYEKTRYNIISLSFKKLIDMDAEFKDFLVLICLFDSQNIPKKLLINYKGEKPTYEFLTALRKHSLITSEIFVGNKEDENAFSIHRSTQKLGKEYLLQLLASEIKENLLEKVILTVTDYYEQNVEDYIKLNGLIPHIEALLRNINSQDLPKESKARFVAYLDYMLGGCYLRVQNNLALSKKHLSKAYEVSKDKNYISQHRLAIVLKDLAYIYGETGDVHNTMLYAKESIKLCPKNGECDLLVAHNLKNMAIVLSDVDPATYYFESALKILSSMNDNKQKIELQAEIYRLLARIYSETYLNKPKAQEALTYIAQALKILEVSKKYFNKDVKLNSNELVEAKARQGHIYCRMGKYEEAMRAFNTILYILDLSEETSFHNLLKAYINLGYGEVLLRRGNLKQAIISLTGSINISSQLIGDSDTHNARTYRAEALIRSHNLVEAYKDSTLVMSFPKHIKKTETQHGILNYIICFYHAAFIKFKEERDYQSMEHFEIFIKEMNDFCQNFLDQKIYTKLLNKGVFKTYTYHLEDGKENLRKYLANSVDIFTAIYGASHPFVRDYIVPNHVGTNKPWYKFF